MISNILKGTIKLTVTSLCVAYITYVHADKITNTVNTVKYTFTEPEAGFVKKEQALDLKIIYERNGKGNLETYFRTYNQKLPIYQKPEGLMIGSLEYQIKNFSSEEKLKLCPVQQCPEYANAIAPANVLPGANTLQNLDIPVNTNNPANINIPAGNYSNSADNYNSNSRIKDSDRIKKILYDLYAAIEEEKK